MSYLEVSGIEKAFGKYAVLQQINFLLPAHQTLSILGKSGCGKTTLLKILAGLERQAAGQIKVEGALMDAVAPEVRNMVYLHQEALLFPHLSVFDNIAFGLRIRKEAPEAIQQKVEEMLHNLKLEKHGHKKPHQLSGGQKQRVNFGRALIINPRVLLLDEPFGNLDAETRQQMQAFYKEVAKQYGITSVFVTHDVKEALKMGHQVGYMHEGRLQIYKTLEEFIADQKVGAQQEIEFWNTIKTQLHVDQKGLSSY